MKRLSLAGLATVAVATAASAQSPTGSAGQAAGTPAPAPACSGSEYRQLDFWVGNWALEFDRPNGGVALASNRITRDEYGACVITEHFEQADIGYVGTSVSIYDPQLRTWRQTWVDNSGGVFVLTGGPVTGQDHVFEMRTVDRGSQGTIQRMIWQDVREDSLTWRWQSETPAGDWVDTWVLRYRRQAG